MAAVVLIAIVLGLQAAHPQASAPSWTREAAAAAAHSGTLEEAQRFFYNGDYDRSAAVTDVICAARPDDLEACELRTASLLFQIRKALEETGAAQVPHDAQSDGAEYHAYPSRAVIFALRNQGDSTPHVAARRVR